jgi:fibro-slime domain-containing protein
MQMKFLPLLFIFTAMGCSSEDPGQVGGSGNGGGGGGGGDGGSGGSVFIDLDGGHGTGGNVGTTTGNTGELTIVIRDFRKYDTNDSTTNPDFENVPKTDGEGNPVEENTYWGPWEDKNIVTDTLDDDSKPVYKNASGTTLTTHGKDTFNQWFRNVEGVNIVKEIPLTLTKNSAGNFEYDSQKGGPLSPGGMFFPIDDNTQYSTTFGNQGDAHNFSFTGEIHTIFTYKGGETFYFRGDDDVFVFIDKKLVINLGGIHGKLDANVSIDSLGLTKGKAYQLDFFYAERHVVESNMRITTSLELVTNPDIPIF